MQQSLQNDRERTALLSHREVIQNLAIARGPQNVLSRLMQELKDEEVPVRGIAVFDNSHTVISDVGILKNKLSPDVKGSSVQPIVDENGWDGHVVFSPIRTGDGVQVGVLAIEYNATSLLDLIMNVSSLGETGEVLLGMKQGEDLVLLHHRFQPHGTKSLLLGSTKEQYEYGAPLALSVLGEEGVESAEDYFRSRCFCGV